MGNVDVRSSPEKKYDEAKENRQKYLDKLIFRCVDLSADFAMIISIEKTITDSTVEGSNYGARHSTAERLDRAVTHCHAEFSRKHV